MEQIPILAPAAVLVLWSLVVLMWMTATRFPAFAKAGLKMGEAEPGSRYVDVESLLPARVNWKGINASFAWAYVAIRVVHSIWQSTVNIISVRVTLFTLSTLCLWVLAINAVRATLF